LEGVGVLTDDAGGPAGADEIAFSHAMSTRDLVDAGLEASWHSVSTIAVGAFAMMSGLLAFAVVGDLLGLMFGLLGAVWLVGIAPSLLMAFLAGRRPDLMLRQTEMRVSAHGLQTATAMASSTASWATYKRVRPTQRTLLLELGTGAVMFVPMRVLTAAQRDRIETWAAAAGVRAGSSAMEAYLRGGAIGAAAALAIPAIVWIGFASGFLS
jgi:hypothetical protein